MAQKTFSMSDMDALLKNKYGPKIKNTFNESNATLAKIKISDKFVGRKHITAVETSRGIGFGTKALPTATASGGESVEITRKNIYVHVQVQREAMKAAATDEAAFMSIALKASKDAKLGLERNMSRILFGSGDGKLGVTTAAAAGGTAAAPTVVVSTATWKSANFMKDDIIQVNSLSSLFRISAIDRSTRTLTLDRIQGSDDLTADSNAKDLYMQNSKDSDPEGLKGVCDATSGSKYNVNIGDGWQAVQKAAGGNAISEDRLNDAVLTLLETCGEGPDLIVTSFIQYRKLMDLFTSKKTMEITPRNKELAGKLGLKGLVYESPQGKEVPVVFERFVENDRVYLLNTDYIEFMRAPEFGWFDDEGHVFSRNHATGSDSYSAWYGGYGNIFIVPSFQAVITGLATT